MPKPDQINLSISDDDVATIHATIEVLKAKLMPHLKTLDAKDRGSMLKLGNKSVAFVQKSFEYGQQYRNLVPAFLEMDAFSADIKATNTLQAMIRALEPILEALDDSLMLAGSEAYEGALMLYQNVKGATKAKDPNAKMIFDDLSDQFKRAPRRKD